MKGKLMSRLFSSEFILSIIFLFVGLTFLLESRNVRPFQLGDMMPAHIYPRVLSIFLIVCCIVVIVKNVLLALKNDDSKNKTDSDNSFTNEWKKSGFKVPVIMLLMIGYILFMRVLGYFEVGFIFLAFSIFVLGERSKTRFLKSVLIAGIATFLIYFIFVYLLNSYMPNGILFRF